jgi:hypothetical protein
MESGNRSFEMGAKLKYLGKGEHRRIKNVFMKKLRADEV